MLAEPGSGVALGKAMAKKMRVDEMEKDLEKMREKTMTQGNEEKEAEMVAKARAENNEKSWRRYGEWKGGMPKRDVRRQKDWRRSSKTSRS